jgi:hypothetical protein
MSADWEVSKGIRWPSSADKLAQLPTLKPGGTHFLRRPGVLSMFFSLSVRMSIAIDLPQ